MTIFDQQALNPLQRAYLMGRSSLMPLGGVAMHDFREFRCDFTAAELEKSLFELAQKHPVLRTIVDDVELTKKVLNDVTLNIEIIDLSDHELISVQQEVNRLRQHYSHSILPLDRPLWKMCLISMPNDNPDKSAILFTHFDGLVVDGYAIAVLLDELFNKDSSFQAMSVRQTPPSYFANLLADRAYWQNKLDSVENIISLPWKRDLDTIFSPTYKREGIVIPKAAWQAISSLGAQYRLLPNSVLTTALFDVIALWADEHYLLLSMPISNSILQPELGNHSSFIAISYHENPEQTFAEKAKSVQKDVMEALSHTTFSGVELGKMLIKKTTKLVTLPVAITNGLSWGADEYQRAEYISGITQTPQLALDIRIRQTANNDIAIDFDYAEQALPAMVVSQMLQTLEQHLLTLSKASSLDHVNSPSLVVPNTMHACNLPQQIDEVEPVVEDYLAKISEHLYGDNNNNTALICDEKAISYRELGKQIAKIIDQLSTLNISKGDVVAICLPKSPEHVAVTLACSLANVVWLPVDMDSPTDRIQFMLDNCRADLLISDRPVEYGIKVINIHDIISNPDLSETLDYTSIFDGEPGYYLYTSGSTGTPKCVVMNHLATANVVEITNKRWNLTSADVLFAVTPFHHDMSIYELFGAMSLGASLVIPTPEQTKSAMDWAKLVEQHQISIWTSVPAIVDMLLACAEPQQMRSLKLVSQGGDYVKPNVIAKLREYLPAARLFSIGGPTETTIWSIWHEIGPEDTDIIPYGHFLQHNRYYIINEKEQHCPHFVIGTMVMSGVNLANGYLKDGVINQNDFGYITTPEGQQVRVFKTSDRGYFREDGRIIFSGRKEGYLKIRGVRMAAAEIELSLTQHPKIRDAIALACINPQYNVSELVITYVTENNQEVDVSDLRQFLKSKLPNSHIPSRWLQLEQFPLTRNRKIDRKQLQVLAEQEIYQKIAQVSY
jgi:amino acid adenylation domain-containing protein